MTASGRDPNLVARASVATLATVVLLWALWLAWRHPVWPVAAIIGTCAWMILCAGRPLVWLLVLPASVPVASLAPWTGQLIFDEFDLVVAGAVAVEFARLAVSRTSPRAAPATAAERIAVIAFFGLAAASLWRGILDAEGVGTGLFLSYTTAANSVRLAKPLVYALLILLPLRRAVQDPETSTLAGRRLCQGMLIGLTLMSLALAHERWAYPGLLDFSSPYRAVAWFWEMHVGGGAIDAYLALTMPFVVWALRSAGSWRQWAPTALVAILAEYACLTTFSRGVYLAVLGPLSVLAVVLVRRRSGGLSAGFKSKGVWNGTLILLMILQIALVLRPGSFMINRIDNSDRDLRSRIAHWHEGIGLMRSSVDWLSGIGLGRLPNRYSAHASDGEPPGFVEAETEESNTFVRLGGARHDPRLAGQYGLTQRVPIDAGVQHVARLDVRSAAAARIRLSVCTMHLLYEYQCHTAEALVEPTEGTWQPIKVVMNGQPLAVGPWYARRTGVLSVSVLTPGVIVDLDNLSLQSTDGIEQLHNGDFAQQLTRWFPVAKNHFLSWHIDNLYLEILIERGAAGLLAFLAVIGFAVWRLTLGPARRHSLSPWLLASLCGVMTVGLVSSVMDVPRVAFLFFLILLFSILYKPP